MSKQILKKTAIQLGKTLAVLPFNTMNSYANTLFDKKDSNIAKEELDFLNNTKLHEITYEIPNQDDPDAGKLFKVKGNGDFVRFSDRAATNGEMRSDVLRNLLDQEKDRNKTVGEVITHAIRSPEHSDLLLRYKASLTGTLAKQSFANEAMSEEHFTLFTNMLLDKINKKIARGEIPRDLDPLKIQNNTDAIQDKLWEGIDVAKIYDITEALSLVNSVKIKEKGEELIQRGHSKAGKEALILYSNLELLENQLINNKISVVEFAKKSNELIERAQQGSLKNHRGIFGAMAHGILTVLHTLSMGAVSTKSSASIQLTDEISDSLINIRKAGTKEIQYIEELEQKLLKKVTELAQAGSKTIGTVYQTLQQELEIQKMKLLQGEITAQSFTDNSLQLINQSQINETYNSALLYSATTTLQTELKGMIDTFSKQGMMGMAKEAQDIYDQFGSLKTKLMNKEITLEQFGQECGALDDKTQKINHAFEVTEAIAAVNAQQKDIQTKIGILQGSKCEGAVEALKKAELLNSDLETQKNKLNDGSIDISAFKNECNKLSQKLDDINQISIKIELYQAVDVDKIKVKAELLNKHGYMKAGEAATELYINLQGLKNKLFKNEIGEKEFKSACSKLINDSQKGVLSEHRGFFGNISHGILSALNVLTKGYIPIQASQQISEIENSLKTVEKAKQPKYLETFKSNSNKMKDALRTIKENAIQPVSSVKLTELPDQEEETQSHRTSRTSIS